jgi:phenylalanyl-tRNA synthetase beta chain
VTPPSRRFDIAIEEDLIEEVARIHGYDAIPDQLRRRRASAWLHAQRDAAGRGRAAPRSWRRATTSRRSTSPSSMRRCSRWGFADGAVPLANPLSAELGVMRTALLPGLVAALRATSRARRRGAPVRARPVFAQAMAAPRETLRFAAVATGRARGRAVGRRRARGRLSISRATSSLPRWPVPASSRIPAVAAGWAAPGPTCCGSGWRGATASAGSASCIRACSMRWTSTRTWWPSSWTWSRCSGAAAAARPAELSRSRPSAGTSRSSSPKHPWAAFVGLRPGRRGPGPARAPAVRPLPARGSSRIQEPRYGLILQDESRTLTDRDVDPWWPTWSPCGAHGAVSWVGTFGVRSQGDETMALTKAEMAERCSRTWASTSARRRSSSTLLRCVARGAASTASRSSCRASATSTCARRTSAPGRNPKTGEEIPISARTVVTFRPGQKLKERVEAYAGSGQ